MLPRMATVAAGIEGLDRARKDSADGVERRQRPFGSTLLGAELRRTPTHADERGTLTEVFDLRWEFTDDPLVYVYLATLRPEQIRGWVVHLEQNDRLFAYAGVLKIVLYDSRDESHTYGLSTSSISEATIERC